MRLLATHTYRDRNVGSEIVGIAPIKALEGMTVCAELMTRLEEARPPVTDMLAMMLPLVTLSTKLPSTRLQLLDRTKKVIRAQDRTWLSLRT